MHTVLLSRRWWAGVTGALALGGALLTTGAAAQTPTPAAPAAIRECPPPPTPAQIAEMQQRFATNLANALGKSPAAVQRALQEAERQVPAPLAGVGEPAQVVAIYDDLAALAPAATQLGVPVQVLAEALKAAMPASVCVQIAVAGPGAVTDIEKSAVEVDMSPVFAAVAQRLGRGITTAQVEAAMKLARPAPEHHPVPAPVSIEEHLQALAKALDVSVEQLKAALQTTSGGGIVVIRSPHAP